MAYSTILLQPRFQKSKITLKWHSPLMKYMTNIAFRLQIELTVTFSGFKETWRVSSELFVLLVRQFCSPLKQTYSLSQKSTLNIKFKCKFSAQNVCTSILSWSGFSLRDYTQLENTFYTFIHILSYPLIKI